MLFGSQYGKDEAAEGTAAMIGTAGLLVVASGMIHSIWNVFAKKSMDTGVFLWMTQTIAAVVFLPLAISDLGRFQPVPQAWLWILISVTMHATYMVLLATAYRIGDLSQVYPIMRGTSLMLVPVAGAVVLNEALTAAGWIGVALIVLGIVLASDLSSASRSSSRAVPYALAVGVCVAGYIFFDKVALTRVPAYLLNEMTSIGNAVVLSWLALRSSNIRREWTRNWPIVLLGGVMAPGGYLLFLFALTLGPVAQLAPMREIGTVFGALMGVFILKEPQAGRRLLAASIITAGVLTLGFLGT